MALLSLTAFVIQTSDGVDYFSHSGTSETQWTVPNGFYDSDSSANDLEIDRCPAESVPVIDSSFSPDSMPVVYVADVYCLIVTKFFFDVSLRRILFNLTNILISGEIMIRTLYSVVDENVPQRYKGNRKSQ